MRKIAIIIFCIIALLFCLSGCINHHIKPPLEQVDMSKLPDITTKHPVAVIGVYNPGAPMIQFCQGGAHRYFITIDDLTDAAVRNLEAMLKQKNIAVDAKADKKLSIAASNPGCAGAPPYGLNYYITLQVQTGDGTTRTFLGQNVGGHIFGTDSHISGAINEAFLEMFRNETIVSYLKN
jgi:hypothetical protein